DPELLGWRVYGETAKPSPTPTFAWKACGTFSSAWLIQMQAREEDWPVTSVEVLPDGEAGDLRFAVHRKDGGIDHVIRRFPGDAAVTFDSTEVKGDLAIITRDSENRLKPGLELNDGLDSVAKRLLK
ncbi:MAG: hypothetical protein P1U58_19035, partial [Verrucomicrobiales bacterium]|nr:hypothetical protein [Verrucomicrobiales bacterium]